MPGQVRRPPDGRVHRHEHRDRVAPHQYGAEAGGQRASASGHSPEVAGHPAQGEVGVTVGHPYRVVDFPRRVEQFDLQTVLGEQTVRCCR